METEVVANKNDNKTTEPQEKTTEPQEKTTNGEPTEDKMEVCEYT